MGLDTGYAQTGLNGEIILTNKGGVVTALLPDDGILVELNSRVIMYTDR